MARSVTRRLCVSTGRIISLSWHPAGTLIAAGMVDMIRIFDTTTGEDGSAGASMFSRPALIGCACCPGHASRRLLVERGVGASKSREVVVWGLVFLSDRTIASADSAGKVQFWDGHTGTLIRSHPVSKWDVLALSASQVSRSAGWGARRSAQPDGL